MLGIQIPRTTSGAQASITSSIPRSRRANETRRGARCAMRPAYQACGSTISDTRSSRDCWRLANRITLSNRSPDTLCAGCSSTTRTSSSGRRRPHSRVDESGRTGPLKRPNDCPRRRPALLLGIYGRPTRCEAALYSGRLEGLRSPGGRAGLQWEITQPIGHHSRLAVVGSLLRFHGRAYGIALARYQRQWSLRMSPLEIAPTRMRPDADAERAS